MGAYTAATFDWTKKSTIYIKSTILSSTSYKYHLSNGKSASCIFEHLSVGKLHAKANEIDRVPAFTVHYFASNTRSIYLAAIVVRIRGKAHTFTNFWKEKLPLARNGPWNRCNQNVECRCRTQNLAA